MFKVKIFTQCTAGLLSLSLLLGTNLAAEAKSLPGWGRARQEFMKNALLDPKQPKHFRGALQNQLNLWRQKGKTSFPRFKNPQGYDIGHNPMKRGSVNIKDLRFETRNDNRSRPQRAKARGRKKGIVAKYF
jgi:hypothetical protein